MDSCTAMNCVWKEYHTTTIVSNELKFGDYMATSNGFGADGPNVREQVTTSKMPFS